MRIKPFTVLIVVTLIVGCGIGLWLRQQTPSAHERPAQPQDLVEQFRAYSAAGDWSRALPAIEALVQRAPHIATSWFNWGVCLDGLGRHSEAASKFMKAYSLQPTDFRAQHRVFRSLSLAHQFDPFLEFARQESVKVPAVLDLLSSDPAFSQFAQRAEFRALLSQSAHSGQAR